MDTQTTPQIAVPLPQMSPKLPKASLLFKQAFESYKKNIVLIVSIFAVPFVLSVIQMIGILPQVSVFIAFLFGIAASVISYLATIALIYILSRSDDTAKELGSAYSGALPYFFPAIWVGILTGLAMAGGFLLFFVPGVIISLLLTFTLYILIIENLHGVNALIKSWHYVKGSLWELICKVAFFAVISLVVFTILGIISAPFSKLSISPVTQKAIYTQPLSFQILIEIISTFLITPLGFIYTLFVYRALSSVKPEMSTERAASIKKKIIIFWIIGAIAIILLLISFGAVIASIANGTIHLPGLFQTASVFSSINPIFNVAK